MRPLTVLVATLGLAAACGGESAIPDDEPASADSGLAVTIPDPESFDVTVTGRVVDAESQEGVEGSYVIVLAPGVSFAEWERSDPDDVEGLMAGAAVTDSTGRYRVVALPRGRDFTVVVAARGHDPAVFENGLSVRSDDPPTTRIADVPLDPR